MSRRTEVRLIYEGANISRDIAPYFLTMRYTDSGAGKSDNLSITLQDRDGKWRGAWRPKMGDRIEAAIVLLDWKWPGSKQEVDCGVFEVDSLQYNGPPDTITIEAVAYPIASGLKNEKKTRAWEKVSLRQIARRIADTAGLRLQYETYDVSYDRIDQTQQSDIEFLAQLAEKEGATVKITKGAIVVYDDRRFESVPPVRTIERGVSNVKSYSFDYSIVGASYAACTLTYRDSANNRTIKGTFRVPGATGPELKINERVESEAEAVRLARNALRRENREAQRASFQLAGDPGMVQGITVAVKGYGAFDGTYFVETATHSIGGGGYETGIELRKVLTY